MMSHVSCPAARLMGAKGPQICLATYCLLVINNLWD